MALTVVRNKMVRTKVCCFMSFPKFQYNKLLPTYCRLVDRVATKSATRWQLLRLRGSYGETCVINFGHNGLLVLVVIRRLSQGG